MKARRERLASKWGATLTALRDRAEQA